MSNKSFTLIEILVTVLLVGTISAFVFLSSDSFRENAKQTNVLMFSQKLKTSLADNIAGEWNLDEGSGSSVSDSSGNGNTGAITGTTWETSRSNCVLGKCLYFSGGTGNYVQFSAISTLTAGSSFVISSWVYPETTGTYRTIVGYNSTHRLLILNSGQMLSQQNNDFFSAGAGDVPNQKWTHVLYWYKRSEGTYGQERWYINGAQSGTARSLPSQIAEWDAAFKMGQYDLVNYPYKGRIDELVIFDNYLTISEIQNVYISGLNKLFIKGQIAKEEYLNRVNLASVE